MVVLVTPGTLTSSSCLPTTAELAPRLAGGRIRRGGGAAVRVRPRPYLVTPVPTNKPAYPDRPRPYCRRFWTVAGVLSEIAAWSHRRRDSATPPLPLCSRSKGLSR